MSHFPLRNSSFFGPRCIEEFGINWICQRLTTQKSKEPNQLNSSQSFGVDVKGYSNPRQPNTQMDRILGNHEASSATSWIWLKYISLYYLGFLVPAFELYLSSHLSPLQSQSGRLFWELLLCSESLCLSSSGLPGRLDQHNGTLWILGMPLLWPAVTSSSMDVKK